MIVAYSRDETDFEHNGLGPLEPVSCEVSEVLNGEWALTLKHTREDAVKCARLQIGNIIRAPVPAGFTPVLTHGEGGTEIYRVRIYDPGSHLLLRQKPSTSSPILGRYELGVEVVVLNAHDSERDADWYECATPDGKHGYMHSAYLVYVRTEDSPEAAEGTVKEPKPLRDQLFRIAKIEPELDSVTVYARHIFYDLMDNLVGPYKVEGATGEAAAAGALHIRLGGTHLYFGKPVEKPTIGDADRPAEEADIRRVNLLLYGTSFLMMLIAAATGLIG